jgi:cytochrome c oxidase subunit 3
MGMPAGLAEPEVLIVETPEQVKPGGPGGGGPRDFEPGGDGWGGGGDDDERYRRTERGPSMGMIGLIATMFSITALFATIVIAFLVRAQTRAHWNPIHVPSLLWASTVLIVASSGTLELAHRAFTVYRARVYTRWLSVTFFLGLGFLLLQAMSLRQLVMQGAYLRQNPHSSLLYIITFVHGFHLFGGVLALFYMIYRASQHTSDVRADLIAQRSAFQVSSVYWHYLDLLWLALFSMLLLWK